MFPIANTPASNTTMLSLLDRVNTISYTISTQALTANGDANGAVNSGNAYHSGIFSSNTIAVAGALRGGNVQSNGDLVVVSNIIQNGTALAANQASTTNTDPNQLIDTFSATNFRTTKYVIQITSGSNYSATELMLLHDGSNVVMTEYATLLSNTSLGTITANIVLSSVNLYFSPVNSINTVKFYRTSLPV